MTIPLEVLSALAAVSSAVAAIVALIIIWRAPKAAAAYAENLRIRNERQAEVRRLKLYIFSELMKARGVQITRDSVASFNLIDLVFKDSQKVRDAWAELYSAYGKLNETPDIYITQLLTSLLRVMAEDLGLSGDLRSADFERYYYPTALAEEDRARVAHQKAIISQLQSAGSKDSPEKRTNLFPPRPTSGATD